MTEGAVACCSMGGVSQASRFRTGKRFEYLDISQYWIEMGLVGDART